MKYCKTTNCQDFDSIELFNFSFLLSMVHGDGTTVAKPQLCL